MNNELKIVVLAAGKGTRLQTECSDMPKVMRKVCDRPLLSFVTDALSFVEKNNIIIVVGYKREEVMSGFPGYKFALQEQQLGTGHAVMAAADELKGFEGAVLVCYGDMPVIKRDTYEALVKTHFEQNNDCTILTAQSEDSMQFGRIIRNENGDFVEVVEDRDCTPEQKTITELNSGVYVFRAQLLLETLKDIKNNNAQNEYYLTDAPAIMRSKGAKIGLLKRDLGDEIIGVNNIEQLRQVESILSER
jgi:UDP-N-acetylglucosamine diphosphorylase/glucosamine-1-phosphate N-acetyltransferase